MSLCRDPTGRLVKPARRKQLGRAPDRSRPRQPIPVLDRERHCPMLPGTSSGFQGTTSKPFSASTDGSIARMASCS